MPNPNDGYFQLMQSISDDKPVTIKVYNTLGATVYMANRTFAGNVANLDLARLAPGMYNIVLHDSKGSSYSLKFVKR